MKLKLPNWGSLCNPNLLLNSDFKSGIINQKGLTTYNPVDVWTLSIDGWIYNGQMQVFVQDEKIRLYSNSSNTGTTYFQQKVGNLNNGEYLLYIHVESLSGNAQVSVENGVNIPLKVGDNYITKNVSDKSLQVRILLNGKGVDLVIDEMKLEKGKYFTGMPAWSETLELLKCYAKYYGFNAQPNITNYKYMLAVQVATNKVRMTIDLPTQINKTPSVKVGYLYIVNIANGTWHLVTAVTDINYVANKLTLDLQTQNNISSSVNNPVYAMFTKDGYLVVDMYDY